MDIKLSDAQWTTAEAVVAFAKAAGIENITVTQLYVNFDNAKVVALIGAQMRQLVEKVSGHQINIINA